MLGMFVGTLRRPPGALLLQHVSVTNKSVFSQISKPKVEHLIAALPELLAHSCVVSLFVALRDCMHHQSKLLCIFTWQEDVFVQIA